MSNIIARANIAAPHYKWILRYVDRKGFGAIFLDDYGPHSAELHPSRFREHILSHFGPTLRGRVEEVLRKAEELDACLLIENGKPPTITLYAESVKWKPIPPPSGVRPLIFVLEGGLERDDVSCRGIPEAFKYMDRPASIFRLPHERGDRWEYGTPLKYGRHGTSPCAPKFYEDREAVLFEGVEGQRWLTQIVQEAKKAGAVIIVDAYTTDGDGERAIRRLSDLLSPIVPVHHFPMIEDPNDRVCLYRAAWDETMKLLSPTARSD